ncbi:MAG TPA: hypothetical protein VKU41_22470 [Polyangiaceae bacterium]|nr:hypothetical protein [Polyangiaceae bacterium]
MTGVGGAYIASAEDTEGSAVNSAAPAVRDPYSTAWFDYDLSVGASLPGAFTRTDFDNHGDSAVVPGHARAGDFVDLTLGATMQFGGLGAAATGDLQQFSLTTSTPGTPGLTLQVGRYKGLGAYGLLGGQLVLGGGARVLTLQIQQDGAGNLLTMTGFAPEAGALLMPTGRQWRIGATARAPVSGSIFGNGRTTEAGGVRSVGQFVLPSQVVMPWEVEVGLAYQLGPRPLNPGWPNPHEQERWLRQRIEEDRRSRRAARDEELASLPPGEREGRRVELDAEEASVRAIEDQHMAAESERLRKVRVARYANWPRERILLLASALLTGPSSDAVSLEGFLDQRVETVGRSLSVTPRLGIEGEPLRDRMILRAGTYVEPSRYDGGTPRQHVTFGGDVRLFPLDFWGLLPEANWKVTMSLDLAPRYTSAGLGIGEWH